MYSNKLVAAIAIDKKVIRETDHDKVYLPFGSEYSIYLKNEHSTKVLINITIDGSAIIEGGKDLVLDPGESHYLSTKMENGKHYNLKFIEKTQQIADYRGNKASDGLVSITYQFLKQKLLATQSYPRRISGDGYYKKTFYDYTSIPMSYGTCVNSSSFGSTPVSVLSNVSSFNAPDCATNHDGFTVNGKKRDDVNYQDVHISDELEHIVHTLVLHLKGGTPDKPVVAAVTTRTKLVCASCGQSNPSNNKFCGNCGTGLEL